MVGKSGHVCQIRNFAVAAVRARVDPEFDLAFGKCRLQLFHQGDRGVGGFLDPEHDLHRRRVTLAAERGETPEKSGTLSMQGLENGHRQRLAIRGRPVAAEAQHHGGCSRKIEAADTGRQEAEIR